MPWIIGAAVLGSAAIGGASSLMGGKSSSAASDTSANLQNNQYLQTRQDFAPWRNSGVGALDKINALLGVGGSGSAASPGSAGVTAPGSNVNAFATPLVGKLYANQSSRGKTPIQDIEAALALGRKITDAQWAQAGFGPGGAGYYQTPSVAQANPNAGSAIVGYNPDGSPQYGSVNAFMSGGAPSAPAPVDAKTAQTNAFNDFQADPGYQFALDEGTKALQNSAASRGILNSGATAKALTQYSQGVASQQYGNYFARLQSLAGLGQSATGSTASAGAAAVGNAGNALTAGGNARASAYGGVATSANQGIQNYLLSQNGGGYASPNGSGGWNTGPQGFPIYN